MESSADNAYEDEELVDASEWKKPEGYETVSTDVAAYWEPKNGPLYWIPQRIRLMDNTQDAGKSSALIIGLLDHEPQTLITNAATKRERVPHQFQPGTVVGVWAKAGMRDLLDLAGAKVWMAPAGKREMRGGGRNPMQLFEITRDVNGPKGERLELIEDSRKASLSEPVDRELEDQQPPWYLKVLPDGGMAQAREAWALKAERAKSVGSKSESNSEASAVIT